MDLTTRLTRKSSHPPGDGSVRRPGSVRRAPARSAKVTPPQPGNQVLVRPRLTERLLQTSAAWWVGAPAASGKTVLAATAARATKGPLVWYQIDSTDADPAACLHYLAQAAAALPGHRRSPALAVGREAGADLEGSLHAWLRHWFAGLPAGTTVVFDDWHRLPGGHPLHARLPQLLDERPPSVSLWLLSRDPAPPALDAAQLAGRLLTLGLGELAFNVEEVGHLLASRRPRPHPEPGLAERWHRWSDGWIGALVFALAAGREVAAAPDAQRASMAPVFGALAAELVDNAPAEQRRFMLDTAWAPTLTRPLAERLSPGADVVEQLKRLVQRQLLIPLPGADGWRYHPLLREVLLDRAAAALAPEQRASRLESAAAALADSGQPEAAAELLIQAEAWPALQSLLLRQAEALLQQGRYATVAAWAAALPPDSRTPWVEFWWAAASTARDAREGLSHFERAYAGFWELGDAEGLYRAWCGVIESATFSCDDYGLLALWLQRLRTLRQRHRVPSLRTRAQLAVYAFAAGFLVQPQPPEFAGWLRGVQRLYRFAPRRADRAAIGGLLGLHHCANGSMGSLGAHLHGLRPLLDDPSVPAFYRLVGGVSDVIHHWIGGDAADALARIAHYERLAQDSGARALDTQYAFQAVYPHALRGEIDAASARLRTVAPQLPRLGRIDSAQHAFQQGWLAALSGRLDEARQLLHDAVDDARARRFRFFETICRGLLAEIAALTGDLATARDQAARAVDQAESQGSLTALVPSLLQRATVARCSGDADTTEWLARGLSLARQHGHWAWGGLLPQTLAPLALLALQQGIERPFVRELIRRRNLPPPPGAGAEWPWPLVLHGLGELQIERSGQRLERAGSKGAQRPLDLLRALLAQSPRPLPVHQALAWIWPDTEAADQRKAFDVTLLRARRLLGDDQLLRLEGGSLAFDEARVWTDVGALLRLCDEIGAADGQAPDPRAPRWAGELLALARGPLLAEDHEPWIAPARERIRRRGSAAAERLAGWLAPAPLARELLQRVFDLDPASEPLACRLARLLAERGDRREALRVLRLCEAQRVQAGEPGVTDDTKALLQRLAAGD